MDTALSPGGKVLLALVLVLGILIFSLRVLKIVRLIRAGREENRLDQFWTRLSTALAYTFGQSKVMRSPVAGAAHLAIFYGFLVISVGTVDMVWGGFTGTRFLPVVTESPAFVWLLDILAVLVIVAVLVSAYRRYVVHPPEVKNSISAAGVLTTIFFLMVSLLGVEAAGSLLAPSTNAPPVGAWLGRALSGLNNDQLSLVHAASWWVHILLVIGFLVYIPHSKHMHLIVCSVNEFLRSLRPKGELAFVNVDSTSFIGAGSFDQLGWKQLTDLFGCTECGRCQQFCPALLSGRPLQPRQVILDLKHGLLNQKNNGGSNGSAVPDAVGRESIWACTTCRACQEHCPVFIEHIDKIIEARRFLLESEGASPTLSKALESLSRLGNPMVLPPSERSTFADTLNVPVVNGKAPELVLWLGCAGTYTPVAQDAIAALVKILKAAKVEFAILGNEKCCGDTARRVGEEGLFQELAKCNIENFSSVGVKKVLTNCPHCYNTFKNEYPRFGAAFTVVNHLEFISELINTKRIELSRPFDQAMTFHDPCYLGRYNDVYDLPREILGKTTSGGVREMARNRDRAVCCGGGGGQMYLESTAGTRINRLRFAEAEELSVPMLATACPYCKTMMTDAAQYGSGGPKVRVKDIAELVSDAMAPM